MAFDLMAILEDPMSPVCIIGGLIGGIVLTWLIYKREKKKIEKEREDLRQGRY